MSAVTMSRQLGSLGREVARLVADRLGYRLVWREVINQAARQAGAPEVALATIDELGLLGLHPSLKACAAYVQAVRHIVEALATEGDVVIVGRAGQVILRDRPDVLHVQVIAPAEVRAGRIARQHGIALEAAQAQIEASDRHRRNYLRRFYHARWDDPTLYDLIVNTARMTPDAAAELMCAALPLRLRVSGEGRAQAQEPFLELD